MPVTDCQVRAPRNAEGRKVNNHNYNLSPKLLCFQVGTARWPNALAVAAPRHVSMTASSVERQEQVTCQMDTTDLQAGDGDFLEAVINPEYDCASPSRAALWDAATKRYRLQNW